MAQYSIEEAMLHGTTVKDEKIVQHRLSYQGKYQNALFQIGSAVAHAHGCKTLQSKSYYPTVKTLYVIGYESDVERVIMLDTSLQVQAQVALAAARKGGLVSSWMTAHEKFLEQREFLFGFASGVRTRLARAKQAGRQDYVSEQVAAGASESQVAEGMELVVRSREERIDLWIEEEYPKLGKGRSAAMSRGSRSSQRAGHEAGLRADTGSSGRVGQRRSLTK